MRNNNKNQNNIILKYFPITMVVSTVIFLIVSLGPKVFAQIVIYFILLNILYFGINSYFFSKGVDQSKEEFKTFYSKIYNKINGYNNKISKKVGNIYDKNFEFRDKIYSEEFHNFSNNENLTKNNLESIPTNMGSSTEKMVSNKQHYKESIDFNLNESAKKDLQSTLKTGEEGMYTFED